MCEITIYQLKPSIVTYVFTFTNYDVLKEDSSHANDVLDVLDTDTTPKKTTGSATGSEKISGEFVI